MADKDNRIRSHESRASVLVVEDDPEIAGAILEVLVYGGFQVEIAETGRRVLHFLMTDLHFDLVIADMTMRKMHDLELLRGFYELRRNLPVIVMNGYTTLKSGLQPIGKGPFAYVPNPFKMKLINAVHTALKDCC